MRVQLSSGVSVAGLEVDIDFDGVRVRALEGETISAALHAQGIQTFRRTRQSSPRGLYCGMGACFDCLVTVDGRVGVRACLEKVQAGQVIRSAMPQGTTGDPLAPLTPAPSHAEPRSVSVDVLVVGAGPAGLSAAVAAAQCGAKVTVLDERAQSGGQYFKPLAPSHQAAAAPDQQFAQGLALTREAQALGVTLLQDVTVWGGDSKDDMLAVVDGEALVFRAAQLILATGAYERPVPFKDWTLPGVMTTGAAQTLVRAYKVSPGQKVVIAGNGPLNLQLACEMVRAGVQVQALLEQAPMPAASQWRELARAVWHGPDLMFEGLRYLAELKRHGVQVLWSHQVLAAQGEGSVQSVVIAPLNALGEPDPARAQTLQADTLCVGYGFVPSTELARALGCEHRVIDKHLGYLATVTDADGRTGSDGVYAVGDGADIGGARVALARGRLAGLAAAQRLGLVVSEAAAPAAAQKQLQRALDFQQALWSLFKSSPVRLSALDDSTLICRCEEVSLGTVRALVDEGFDSLGAIKRMSRLGMGRCQGRYCAGSCARLLEEVSHKPRQPEQMFAPRLPAKPVPAACLAFEKPEWGGHRRSITPNLARPTRSEPLGKQQTDVLVIGGGVMGACLAYYLAREGRDVLLVERDEANFQASGANAGSLHVQLLSFDFGSKAEAGGRPAAQTLPLGPASVALWRELQTQCDADFEVTVTGGLMVADSAQGLAFLRDKAALERSFGIDNEIIGPSELRALAPALSEQLLGAEYAPQEGKINPLKATYGVLKAARQLGARVVQGTSVESMARSGSRWLVQTSRGPIEAGTIVNAAGPWASEVAAMVGLTVPVHSAPLQMIVTEPAPPLVKQLVAHADRHLSLKQASTGGLIIGGGWTAGYNPQRRFNTALRHSVEGNLWVAQRVLPAVQGLRVLRTWAAMNINIDGAPILGSTAAVPHFFNAVTSNGYTLSPVVARLTVELILGRQTSMDSSAFTLDRFGV